MQQGLKDLVRYDWHNGTHHKPQHAIQVTLQLWDKWKPWYYWLRGKLRAEQSGPDTYLCRCTVLLKTPKDVNHFKNTMKIMSAPLSKQYSTTRQATWPTAGCFICKHFYWSITVTLRNACITCAEFKVLLRQAYTHVPTTQDQTENTVSTPEASLPAIILVVTLPKDNL
jgi:hypothetical protein